MNQVYLSEYEEEDRFHAAVLRIVELLKTVDEFGVTHIVSGDGNMDDENLDFVENQMKSDLTTVAEDRELISLLRSLHPEAREAIWILADYVTFPK